MATSGRGLRVEGALDARGRPCALTIDGGGLLAVAEPPGDGVDVVDGSGLSVEPGFVDLQVNGGFGCHFTTDPEGIWDVGAGLAAHGVTAFLATLISASIEEARAADELLASGPPDGWVGAVPLGLHLEGPALSPLFRGAHEADRLVEPTAATTAAWRQLASLRLVTLAPELRGAIAAIELLHSAGVVVSVGHTAASPDELSTAVDAGASMATHLFNAMAPFHHRDPGVVGAVLNDDRLAVGLIADGEHVAPDALALVWRAAGPHRLVLTGDVVASLGSGAAAARTAAGHLAGGATPFHEVRATFLTAVGLTSGAPAVTSTNASRLLGEVGRGRLDQGARADLVLLDGQGTPAVTVVGGRVVHDPDRRFSRA